MEDKRILAVKSSVIGLIAQVCTLIINFAVRTVLIKYVSTEILGIDGVLRDYVAMLSLAEMGMTSAMLYRLYKPVNEGDNKSISQLINLYRLIYRVIAIVILLLGIVLGLFLRVLIKDLSVSWLFVYTAFGLQVITSASSYIFAYKRCLLNAAQKNYVIVLIDALSVVFWGIAKIITLVVLKSYFGYLGIYIVQTLSSNIILEIYSRRLYPNLRYKEKWTKEQKKFIFGDTVNLVASKLVGYVYSSTDNIIISAYVSIVQVGLLSNYKYIYSMLKNLITSLVSPISPMVGSALNSDNSKEKNYEIFSNYGFARFFIAEILVVPAIALAQIFIEVWAGKGYLLELSILLLLAIDFYIGCVYGPLGEFIYGLGLFGEDKKIAITGALLNLVISLFGVQLWGVFGVLLGTAISQSVMWIGKYRIIFKHYFPDNIMKKRYFVNQGIYLLFTIIVSAIFYLIWNKVVQSRSIVSFFIMGVITEIVLIILLVIVFGRTGEFRYLADMIRHFIKKKGKVF